MKVIPKEFLLRKEEFKSKLKETVNGCLEWSGPRYIRGYGRVTYRGENFFAHRVLYFVETGVQPLSLNINHKCDNPPCCNIEHLFLGTQGDNMRDKCEKGRSRYKYSLEYIEQAVAYYKENDVYLREIQELFGIERKYFTSIIKERGINLRAKPVKYRVPSQDEIKNIPEIYLSDESLTSADVARLFKINNKKCWTILKAAGIEIRNSRGPFKPRKTFVKRQKHAKLLNLKPKEIL